MSGGAFITALKEAGGAQREREKAAMRKRRGGVGSG